MTQADNERKERNPARTDTALKALKKERKSYQVPIERGLYVEVLPNGTKAFRFR